MMSSEAQDACNNSFNLMILSDVCRLGDAVAHRSSCRMHVNLAAGLQAAELR